MKVLVVGGGGREHAIVRALHQSPKLETLRCAPGNAGISAQAEPVDLSVSDIDGLVGHACSEAYDLVVVGPEGPLVAGLSDRLREAGLAVFGPSAAAAAIEGSKIFSKRFMERHGIPTAAFHVFEDLASCREYLAANDTVYPLVLKADGLAAGKGVVIAANRDEAVEAAEGMLSGRAFGEAGARVLVEECLTGREASFFVLSDGERFVELATCQDYKRAEDGDRGLNTGGMGSYSPSVYLDAELCRTLTDSIVRPTIRGMAAEERPYQGVLYVGVMLTADGPKVLEYNARFGDPETQVLLPRLDGDWLDLLHGCAVGRLPDDPPRWKDGASVCVVMAAGGYPGGYAKGRVIRGIDAAEKLPGVQVVHAGTGHGPSGEVVTTGGRVLGVTALGRNLAEARTRAYAAVDAIEWDEEQHRSDIALDAVKRLEETTP